ncbi:hypothetical protein E2C01_050346 [Portunus trituberculatus]|uniref:Uncharacterized protein n=1 Tax=Portunus trituberculatus TaxID=210409 RepID=A0A5B7GFP0_PORTR|nr:hypothetical protein [Portunus trituberculatus]
MHLARPDHAPKTQSTLSCISDIPTTSVQLIADDNLHRTVTSPFTSLPTAPASPGARIGPNMRAFSAGRVTSYNAHES